MPKINMKPVNNLCDELWNLCTRLAASSDKQAEDWIKHPETYLRLQRECVDPIPEHLKQSVIEVIDIWNEIESSFLLKIKKSQDDFIAEFVKIWDAFTKNDEKWQASALRYGHSCRGVVWNIEWLDAFVWQLPAADPDYIGKYLRIGQMMSAIFCLEIMAKSLEFAALYPEKQDMESDIRSTRARVILVFANYLVQRQKGKKGDEYKIDYSFWDALAIAPEPASLGPAKIWSSFQAIGTLYRKYLIISVILDRGKNLRSEDLTKYDDERDKISTKIYQINKELLTIYEAVNAIMINDIDRFTQAIANARIDINYPLIKTIIFGTPYYESVKNFTFLTVAATIGRYNFVKYLIDHGADISKHILESGPWHTPLSVNECMIMSTLFRWDKSGMKKKIPKSEVKELIDMIIYASKKEPSIVNDEAIHPDESPTRRSIFWKDLGKAAESKDFFKRLMPLNPSAFKALYEP